MSQMAHDLWRPIPIMVKIWVGIGSHRYGYLKRSLPSLLGSELPSNAKVVLVDDRSSDPRAQRLMAECAERCARVELWTNSERLGPNKGQEVNFRRLTERFPDASYFVLCDDDIIYQPGWLQRTLTVAEEAAAAGLNGIFTALNVPFRSSYREVRLPTSDVLLKERQAALNWVVPRAIYERVGPFRDTGIAYDTEYCDRLAALRLPVICLKPSWVQNIGYFGAYQSGTIYTAPDFVGRRGLYLDLVYAYHSVLGRVRSLLPEMKE
jgi:GT2 family glycosyltransferase